MPEKKVSKFDSQLVTDLNIVLSKQQIDAIVKELMKTIELNPGGQVSLAGDYCCVDTSIGSSVAGPFSSVGSSVSYDPGIQSTARTGIREKLSAENLKVNVMLPEKFKIK